MEPRWISRPWPVLAIVAAALLIALLVLWDVVAQFRCLPSALPADFGDSGDPLDGLSTAERLELSRVAEMRYGYDDIDGGPYGFEYDGQPRDSRETGEAYDEYGRLL